MEIAQVLVNEAKAGRLEPAVLPHFINSLQYGGPVPDPKAWLQGVAGDLAQFLPEIVSPKCKKQLLAIAAKLDSAAKKKSVPK
jgi:hypothetical protein